MTRHTFTHELSTGPLNDFAVQELEQSPASHASITINIHRGRPTSRKYYRTIVNITLKFEKNVSFCSCGVISYRSTNWIQ